MFVCPGRGNAMTRRFWTFERRFWRCSTLSAMGGRSRGLSTQQFPRRWIHRNVTSPLCGLMPLVEEVTNGGWTTLRLKSEAPSNEGCPGRKSQSRNYAQAPSQWRGIVFLNRPRRHHRQTAQRLAVPARLRSANLRLPRVQKVGHAILCPATRHAWTRGLLLLLCLRIDVGNIVILKAPRDVLPTDRDALTATLRKRVVEIGATGRCQR
jgi:hypothetical protein